MFPVRGLNTKLIAVLLTKKKSLYDSEMRSVPEILLKTKALQSPSIKKKKSFTKSVENIVNLIKR